MSGFNHISIHSTNYTAILSCSIDAGSIIYHMVHSQRPWQSLYKICIYSSVVSNHWFIYFTN